MTTVRFGFLGAGRMASALARGLVEAKLAASESILASDPSETASENFASHCGARILADNRAVATEANVLFLAVKPQNVKDVLAELHGQLTPRHLLISIAAGVPLKTLASGLGRGPRLVRVMPNTPCLIGEGASGYCLGPGASAEDGRLVQQLLSAVGKAFEVKEELLDAVTGLSGSGPAFVYLIIEALSDGGLQMGLSREAATALAAQTVRGAASMVLATGQHPGILKDQVTSPGGTTIAGLRAMEEHGVRAGLMAAVEAATVRSRELGKAG